MEFLSLTQPYGFNHLEVIQVFLIVLLYFSYSLISYWLLLE